jgi:peroxiredoxin Q/BCP
VLVPALALAQDEGTGRNPPPAPPSGPPRDARSPTFNSEIGGQVVIGERAPDFELDGSDGRKTRLAQLRGDWVLLVFGGRKEELADLTKVVEESRTMGLRIVGIVHEKTYFLRGWAERSRLPFLMLADDTKEIAATYGLYDSERRTIASGFVLLDRDGVVRLALLGQKLPADQILRLARYTMTGS